MDELQIPENRIYKAHVDRLITTKEMILLKKKTTKKKNSGRKRTRTAKEDLSKVLPISQKVKEIFRVLNRLSVSGQFHTNRTS